MATDEEAARPVNTAAPSVAMEVDHSRDFDAEIGRLEGELERLEGELDAIRSRGLEALFPETSGNLFRHAKEELERAGLFGEDADYHGGPARDVLDLIRVFAGGRHSGGSAYLTIELFSRLARFDVLSPITAHPSEWMEVGDGVYQNRRKSSTFWRRGQDTWYDLDDPKKESK